MSSEVNLCLVGFTTATIVYCWLPTDRLCDFSWQICINQVSYFINWMFCTVMIHSSFEGSARTGNLIRNNYCFLLIIITRKLERHCLVWKNSWHGVLRYLYWFNYIIIAFIFTGILKYSLHWIFINFAGMTIMSGLSIMQSSLVLLH